MSTHSPKRFASLLLAALVATFTFAVSPAVACSCAQVNPVDVIDRVDAVFTAMVVDGPGNPAEPVWEMDVVGVVKGQVAKREVVTGEDWAAGCGTNFGSPANPITVFAQKENGQLRAMGCTPLLSEAEFAKLLNADADPVTGEGPAAAVMFGTNGGSDIALVDDRGRTLVKGKVGLEAGMATHCSGTTNAAIVSSNGQASIIDLTTLRAVEQRLIASSSVSSFQGRAMCLDGGAQVASASGTGLEAPTVTVATSHGETSDGLDSIQRFQGHSAAAFHPAGTVLVLPAADGKELLTLSMDDLSEAGEPVNLPDGAKALDGEVSPDGSTLAVLVTLVSNPNYLSGGTHLVTVPLSEGIPTGADIELILLEQKSGSMESGNGIAKWLRWRDDSSVIIEHETSSSKRIQIADLSGTTVMPLTTVDWGWSTASIPTGILRSQGGGIAFLDDDGNTTPGDPAPGLADRLFSIAPLIDAPAFTTEVADVETFSITPLAEDAPATRAEITGASDFDRPGEAPGGPFRVWFALAPVLALCAVLFFFRKSSGGQTRT